MVWDRTQGQAWRIVDNLNHMLIRERLSRIKSVSRNIKVTICLFFLVSITFSLRFFELSHPFLVSVAGFSPLIIIIAVIIILLIALRSRDVRIIILSASLVAGYAVAFTPHNSILGCRAGVASDESFTIFSHNVLWGSGNSKQVAEEIDTYNPDILVFQEASEKFLNELSGYLESNSYEYKRNGTIDLGRVSPTIWSKYSLLEFEQSRFGAAPIFEAKVDSPFGAFVLHGIHTSAPTTKLAAGFWNEQFDLLEEFSTAEPALMVGDFNATKDHKQFRQLLDRGWEDSHDKKGCGIDNTWSLKTYLPSMLRLDHVLHTEHFRTNSVVVGKANNSDHNSVIVELDFVDN